MDNKGKEEKEEEDDPDVVEIRNRRERERERERRDELNGRQRTQFVLFNKRGAIFLFRLWVWAHPVFPSSTWSSSSCAPSAEETDKSHRIYQRIFSQTWSVRSLVDFWRFHSPSLHFLLFKRRREFVSTDLTFMCNPWLSPLILDWDILSYIVIILVWSAWYNLNHSPEWSKWNREKLVNLMKKYISWSEIIIIIIVMMIILTSHKMLMVLLFVVILVSCSRSLFHLHHLIWMSSYSWSETVFLFSRRKCSSEYLHVSPNLCIFLLLLHWFSCSPPYLTFIGFCA